MKGISKNALLLRQLRAGTPARSILIYSTYTAVLRAMLSYRLKKITIFGDALKLFTSLFLLLTLTLFSGIPGYAAKKSDHKVSITLVADEGVMISLGKTSILIDSLGESIHHNILGGQPPFSTIQMAFLSHTHSDHFDPTITRDFLRKHPETTLASSPQVMRIVREGFAGYPQIKNQLKQLKIKKGGIKSISFPGIKGSYVESSHAVSSVIPDRVIGLLVHFGNKKIFYLGESEMTSDIWQHRDFKSIGIDVAILPYWTFKEEATRKVLAEHIAPQKIIVTSDVGHWEKSEFEKILRKYPKVIFLHTVMQSIEVE